MLLEKENARKQTLEQLHERRKQAVRLHKNALVVMQIAFLILDNLRVHHSKIVKAWVAQRLAQIELFYLPSYSPELNPEERLNADLKQEMGKRVPVRTKAGLSVATDGHLAMLDRTPERGMPYHRDHRVRYAA